MSDAKLAKSLHTACKNHGKTTTKRPADASSSPDAKRPRMEMHKRDLDYEAMTADELEGALDLPLEEDEELIRGTSVER